MTIFLIYLLGSIIAFILVLILASESPNHLSEQYEDNMKENWNEFWEDTPRAIIIIGVFTTGSWVGVLGIIVLAIFLAGDNNI